LHLRVKRWDGAAWIAVGEESRELYGAERFEFLLDGDTVLVNGMVPFSGGGDQVVLMWRDGLFTQVGEAVRLTGIRYDPRPGAVVAPPQP
jgi:hypothetical protein